MIIDKQIEIMTCGKAIKYYQNLGYKCGYRTKILVSQLDIPKGSMQKVEVKCDYCGKHFYAKRQDLDRGLVNKHACKSCASLKAKEGNIIKYGTSSYMGTQEGKKRYKETCLKKYGVENIMQSKKHMESALKKTKQTSIELYGAYPASKSESIKNKIKSTFVSSHKVGDIPASKNQIHLCNLYHGILNFPTKYYFLDILLENNIYCEYDGSGHNLNVILGRLTQEEFDRKEIIRYKTLKASGLKMFKIIHKGKKLPNDKKLLHIKQLATQLLSTTDNNWVVFDIDNNLFIIKNYEIKYDENLSVL